MVDLTNKKTQDVPPGLIEVAQREKLSKKRILLLSASAFLISAGILSVYFFETLKGSVLKEKTVSFALKQPSIPEKPQIESQSQEEAKTPQIITSEAQKEETKREIPAKPRPISKKVPKKREVTIAKVQPKQPERPTQPKTTEDRRIEKDQGQDFLFRAYSYEREGKIKEALAEYREYVRLTGSQDPKILNKIAALCVLDRDFNTALYFAELALRVSPRDTQILLNYGVIKAKLGEHDEAERIFRKILEKEPSHKKAIYNLALLKEKRGEIDEAEKLYLELRNLGDREVEEDLRRIRAHK